VAARNSSGLRTAYAVLLGAGIIGVVFAVVFQFVNNDELLAFALFWPGVAALFAAKICMGVLLHRCWACIDRHAGRVRSRGILDPGAAVALTFIPVVNLVGVFFSLGPLPGKLNALAKVAGLPVRLSESHGHAVAVLFACALIPFVGVAIALLNALFVLPPLMLSSSALAESIEDRLEAIGAEPT
jgi:hypothetical protein